MIAALCAILSAAALGAGDFGMGITVRRQGLVPTLVGAHAVTTALIFIVAAAFVPLDLHDAWLAVPVAVCRTIGSLMLARALAIGPLSVTAPISGMNGVVPLVVGLVAGDHLSATQVAGVAACFAGVVLLTSATSGSDVEPHPAGKAGIMYALAALLAMGSEVVFMSHYTAHVEPLQAAATSEVLTLVLFVAGTAIAAARDPRTQYPARSRAALHDRAVLAVGLLQAIGLTLVAVALSTGQLSTVGVLIATYPAMTILLARTVLREQLTRHQAIGAVLALCGMVGVASP
jgi:drug/metabolite transporter (DMT)-like permease